MIVLITLNALLKLLVFMLNSFMLRRFRDRLNQKQRTGLSLVGGGCLLTVPLAVDPVSGFELWSPIVLVFGILVFLWGSTDRLLAHERANEANKVDAYNHLKARGKL